VILGDLVNATEGMF